jgi:DNA-binding NarL/FixJ family response regulator
MRQMTYFLHMTNVPLSTGLLADVPGDVSRDPGRGPPYPLGHPMPLTVALADDNLIVRAGVAQILATKPDMDVVASCGDLESLVEAIEQKRPDVVVTDIWMPPTTTDEGIRLAALMREQYPGLGIVVLSNRTEPAYASALLNSGAEGRAYLLKEQVNDGAQLVAAIEIVAEGGSMLDSKIVEPLVAAKLRIERSPLADLTAREREVLAEIAKGKSNAAIADALVLSKRAVEKHINSIFLKLNLSSAEDVSKRVKATLLFLAETESLESVERRGLCRS